MHLEITVEAAKKQTKQIPLILELHVLCLETDMDDKRKLGVDIISLNKLNSMFQ